MTRKLLILAAILSVAALSCSKDGGSEGNGEGGEPYFSAGENLKVQFAPGNLAYDKTDGYYFVSTITQGDLFCWGTGDRPLYRSDDVDFNDFKNFVDWGDGVSIDGGGWYTPSRQQWSYIITYRKNASKLMAGATVCERWGALLLPDNWKAPKGVKLKMYNGDTTSYEDNIIDEETWAKMAAAGAVFLPYYEAKEKDRYGYDYYEPDGEYHSCSNYDSYGFEINYTIATVVVGKGAALLQWNAQRSRANRAAVRLIRELK